MTEHALTMRPAVIGGQTAEGDYSVRRDGRIIGRIRLSFDHVARKPNCAWNITVPLPLPPWAGGTTDTLETAKDAFRSAWERFYAGLSEEDIALWHKTQDAR